jgi:hypothetical protein
VFARILFDTGFFISKIKSMPKIWIGTDEEKIWFGNSHYFKNYEQTPTRFCIEDVSEAMYNALFEVANRNQECSEAISYLLYSILDKK